MAEPNQWYSEHHPVQMVNDATAWVITSIPPVAGSSNRNNFTLNGGVQQKYLKRVSLPTIPPTASRSRSSTRQRGITLHQHRWTRLLLCQSRTPTHLALAAAKGSSATRATRIGLSRARASRVILSRTPNCSQMRQLKKDVRSKPKQARSPWRVKANCRREWKQGSAQDSKQHLCPANDSYHIDQLLRVGVNGHQVMDFFVAKIDHESTPMDAARRSMQSKYPTASLNPMFRN